MIPISDRALLSGHPRGESSKRKGTLCKMYLQANIDRAIVVTLCDLHGCSIGGLLQRSENSPKGLNATICNFMSYVGMGESRKPTNDSYVGSNDSSFDDYLAMCKRAAQDVDFYQKAAIQMIVKDMLRRVDELNVQISAGKIEPTAYLKPIEKSNYLGKILIALAEAFEVELPASATTPVPA